MLVQMLGLGLVEGMLGDGVIVGTFGHDGLQVNHACTGHECTVAGLVQGCTGSQGLGGVRWRSEGVLRG